MPKELARPKHYISVDEVAERWSVSRQTVYRMVRRGLLKSIQVGSSIRVAIAEVEKYERTS